MQKRKTKIVCSLGPVSSEEPEIKKLILAGMNVARFNFSHGSHESHALVMDRVKKVSNEIGIPVALLLDTKGPEIRTGMVENDGTVKINEGDSVTVTTNGNPTTAAQKGVPAHISITWEEAPEKLQKGHRILIADGLLELDVLNTDAGLINCRAKNTAVIGSKKNVNLIGIHARLPIIGEQDKKDIAFGVKMDVDYIAASFLSFPHEVTEIRKFLTDLNSDIKIIAKIETGEGLENIKEITELADGVMVARGDLGVQLPTEQIPLAQKHIINVCRKVGKPVITATQMLESMIVNPRPTRAELTDVANAVFDGTDALMLSGETAMGAYPEEAVKTMDKIARTVEKSEEFRKRMDIFHKDCFSLTHNSHEDLSVIISKSGVEIASAVNAKAIVTPTISGNTARILSVFRPEKHILAVTPDRRAERSMQLYWGVSTFLRPKVDDSESMIQDTMKVVLDNDAAGISDKIILIAGLPLNSPNMINTVRVLILGTVLARTSGGGCANPAITRAQGRIIHAHTPEEARSGLISYEGEILVCNELTQEYTPIIRLMKGVICEKILEIDEHELRDINPDLVWLTHVRNAASKLESGLTVTIDAEQLLVYEGIV
ncbi:MAG: pyruvate kinase [Treponema sp.]|nr:pyruvate kinase [Treponema sp.]